MSLNININESNYSDSLLFSIPIHEREDVVYNQIENIFNYNPGCKIILHINKTFTTFNKKYIYKNLYFNQSNIQFNKAGDDLFSLHVSNFNYSIQNNIPFDFFVILSSNEMFIKNGTVNYIQHFKNGLQSVQYNPNIDWHNFNHSKILNNDNLNKLLKDLNLKHYFGGQTEGQFYTKLIFKKLSSVYLNSTQNNTFLYPFEAEEILPQTIFKSLNIEYVGNPITLQNYSNKIEFNIPFVKDLIKGTIIPNFKKKSCLDSPHVNLNSDNVFSIKRVDRSFNSLRNFLTQDGFILNSDFNFIKDVQYFSHQSSIQIINSNHLVFNKYFFNNQNYQWFGYFLEKGSYVLSFKYFSNLFLNEWMNCGIKIHSPYSYIISNMFNQFNHFNNNGLININLNLQISQNILFFFDAIQQPIQFHLKNIHIKKSNTIYFSNTKKNIIISFYQQFNNDTFLNHCENIVSNLINKLKSIYNVYIIIFIHSDNIYTTNLKKYLNADHIFYFNSKQSIFYQMTQFINLSFNNIIDYQFILFYNVQLLLLKPIHYLNFIINKFNFLSYQSFNSSSDFNLDLLICPGIYFSLLFNYFNNNNNLSLLSHFNNHNISHYLIFNDLFHSNPLIEYNKSKSFNKKGFIFNHTYKLNITYISNISFFKKLDTNHFHFYKKYSSTYSDFNWCGHKIKFSDETNTNIQIKLQFDFLLNTPIQFNNNQFGIKTHYPIQFYNEWIKTCKLHQFKTIYLNLNIYKKNQYIIFNFDNYLSEIDFEIKNFKIFYNYNL